MKNASIRLPPGNGKLPQANLLIFKAVLLVPCPLAPPKESIRIRHDERHLLTRLFGTMNNVNGVLYTLWPAFLISESQGQEERFAV